MPPPSDSHNPPDARVHELEAEVERLREALKQIAGYEFDPDDTYRRCAHEMKRMAREALEAGER